MIYATVWHILKSAEPYDHRMKWIAIQTHWLLEEFLGSQKPHKTSEIIWKMIGAPAKSNEFFRSSINFLSTTQQFDPMSITLSKTHISLKMVLSDRHFLFQWSIFRGELLILGRVFWLGKMRRFPQHLDSTCFNTSSSQDIHSNHIPAPA